MDEPRKWPDVALVCLLALLAIGLRAWQLTHTEVASRDSIGYIRIAWQLQHDDWRTVLPSAAHHPAYSIAVLATSHPVRYFVRDDLPYAMQLSAQLASALASVLLVVPTFYLGKELFNRRIGFWASLLFQCLPAGGRVLGDGLSEATFLLFAVTGLALAFVALRTGSWVAFALVGLSSGLAYLTRPEGIAVVTATGLVLLGMQVVKRWRFTWPRCLAGCLSLALGFLVVGGPYMATIGGLTVKRTGHMVIENTGADDSAEHEETSPHRASASGVTAGPVWAMWLVGDDQSRSVRHRWALWAFPSVLFKGFFYVMWAPTLLGLVWFRDRFRFPGSWVLLVLGLLLGGVLYRVAVVVGYLSDRHMVLIILCGLYWAVAATELLGRKCALLLVRLRPSLAATHGAREEIWAMALLLSLCITPLFRTLEPLHADRAGFREAGYWLAQHAEPSDSLEDPYSWSSYFAGRVFQEGTSEIPEQNQHLCYVVLERAKNNHPHLGELKILWQRVEGEKEVASWSVRRGKDTASVLIFALRK
jgi:hypothetical protein